MDEKMRDLDKEEKRGRVEQLFDRTLDSLAGCFPLQKRHVGCVRATPIKLASEEVPKLERRLLAGENPAAVADELELFLKGGFHYVPEDGSIVIGMQGEAAPEVVYVTALRAEAVHALVHTAGGFRQSTGKYTRGTYGVGIDVDEFYDLAFRLGEVHGASDWSNWLLISQAGKFRLANIYLNGLHRLGEKADWNLIAEMTIDYLMESKIAEHLPSEKWLRKYVNGTFEEFSTYLQQHVSAYALAWSVIGMIGRARKIPDSGSMLQAVTDFAIKALYDSEVDLSDSARFVETFGKRLPEYLKQDG